jgi:hypothetical protein
VELWPSLRSLDRLLKSMEGKIPRGINDIVTVDWSESPLQNACSTPLKALMFPLTWNRKNCCLCISRVSQLVGSLYPSLLNYGSKCMTSSTISRVLIQSAGGGIPTHIY